MCKQTNADHQAPSITQGLHHLGLTVANVDETAAFLVEQLNFKVAGGKPDYPAIFVTDGTILLTLWQAAAGAAASFDHHTNIGLHHFALKVDSPSRLKQLYQQLSQLQSVVIEFSPEPLSGTAIQHMMCLIPGGLRVEFLALPEAA